MSGDYSGGRTCPGRSHRCRPAATCFISTVSAVPSDPDLAHRFLPDAVCRRALEGASARDRMHEAGYSVARHGTQGAISQETTMKTLLAVLFTGAMLSSSAFSADGDPFSEARFKAKFGRYTAAEEARRGANAQQAGSSAMNCTKHECCSHKGMAAHKTSKSAGFANSNAGFEDAWAQAKFGRSIRRADSANDARVASVGQADSASTQLCTSPCDEPKCCD